MVEGDEDNNNPFLLRARLKKFGPKKEEAIQKELMQLHMLKTFTSLDAEKVSIEVKKRAISSLMGELMQMVESKGNTSTKRSQLSQIKGTADQKCAFFLIPHDFEQLIMITTTAYCNIELNNTSLLDQDEHHDNTESFFIFFLPFSVVSDTGKTVSPHNDVFLVKTLMC